MCNDSKLREISLYDYKINSSYARLAVNIIQTIIPLGCRCGIPYYVNRLSVEGAQNNTYRK